MPKNRPSYDEAEYRSHRASPVVAPNAQPSLFADTTAYLSGAEERVAALTPLESLRSAAERVRIPSPPRPAVALHEPPAGMVRDRDHDTSIGAALAVEPHLSTMQTAVLEAFRAHGAMTDEQLERLPEFADYKYSTARKRRTELVTKGLLASCGKAPNSSGSARMRLWDLSERVKPEACVYCGQPMYWQSNYDHACSADVRDAEPLDCAFREEDGTGRTIGERFNDSEPTY